jgi:M6 family metalloprotease-like protein
MPLDTTYYYRLTNNYLGPNTALDVNPNGSGRLMMAAVGAFSGQYWRPVDLGGGKYAFRTLYLGDNLSLDIINDGVNTTPWLAETGNYSGQYWSVTEWGDGTCKFTNDFTGETKSLDTYSDTHAPFMGPGDHSGQHWTLTKIAKVQNNTPIPPLDPKGSVYKSEGPTDFNFYKKPAGTVKAVVIFVDFSNAPAGSTSATTVANHLLGNGAAQQLFSTQSYGKMSLDVAVKANLGWKRMPLPSTSYSFGTFETHREYIGAAASLFSLSDVRFSDYDFVLVVAPQNAGFPLSPAFNADRGQGASSPSGEIRLAVTFGTDSYSNRYINLVHEVGHLFGLPDLYPYSGDPAKPKAGCWPIMSDIFHSVCFHGWHRHKNEWLDQPRKTYLQSTTATWYKTLSPFSSSYGLSIIALPIDDVENPSKVLVIELAQPVLGTNNQSWGDGVLIYTVDARIPTGESPVVVIPKITSTSPDYGHLYEAAYQVDDVANFNEGNVSIVVSVLQKFGSSYNLRIDCKR